MPSSRSSRMGEVFVFGQGDEVMQLPYEHGAPCRYAKARCDALREVPTIDEAQAVSGREG